jgi:hypothetical protein
MPCSRKRKVLSFPPIVGKEVNFVGAGSSFTRVVQQIDAVLCGKGYLVSGSATEKAIPSLTPRLPGIEV